MNRIDLSGRVAVVTGAARGIGYATAQRFLASGAKVAIWDINAERAKTSAVALSKLGTVSVHEVELTDEAAVQAAAAETLALYGKIDIAVTNAGITGGNGVTWELDPTVWFDVLNVNLYAPYLVCRAVVPHMIKAGHAIAMNDVPPSSSIS